VCVLTCYPNITVHCCLLLFVNIDTPLPQCFASCWHGVQQLRVGCLLETWEIRGRPVTEWFALSRSRKRRRQIILVGTAFLPLFCCPHVRFCSFSLHPHRWIAARNALQFGACRGDPMCKPYSEIKERPIIIRLNLDVGLQMRLREGATRRRMVECMIEEIVLFHLVASNFANPLPAELY
jgi:hypothetical protein